MQVLKYILLPFSLLYGVVMLVRNKMYDQGWFKSYKIPVKSILVGNLSVGGTGKTPHTAYLAELLCKDYKTAILSRGYGRESKGFLWIEASEDVINSGDEPLFYARKFEGELKVAVCESRAEGVKRILKEQKKTDLILLDDAFQHRAVKAGFSILLTDFNKPFYNDLVLPVGRLREFSRGKDRADCIIVSKTPETVTFQQKQRIKEKLMFKNGNVFFSSIQYDELVSFGTKIEGFEKVLLVTGIANPQPLIDYYQSKFKVEVLKFPDHHHFTSQDIAKIHSKFDTFDNENSAIVTTEKDFVRLNQILSVDDKHQYPWYYQAMTIEIDEKEKFNQLIKNYVDTV